MAARAASASLGSSLLPGALTSAASSLLFSAKSADMNGSSWQRTRTARPGPEEEVRDGGKSCATRLGDCDQILDEKKAISYQGMADAQPNLAPGPATCPILAPEEEIEGKGVSTTGNMLAS